MKNVKSLALVALLSSTVPFLTVGCGDIVDNNSTTNTGGSTNNGGNGNSGNTDNGQQGQGDGSANFDTNINLNTCTTLGSTSISRDTTWADGCYKITGQVNISSKLTINPGTKLVFGSDASIYIGSDGTLKAIGTVIAPIIFTGLEKTPGYWRGIWFSGSNNTNNELSHVLVEYGGGSNYYGNIEVGNSRLKVSDSTFRYSEKDGFYIDGDSTIDKFERVISTSNEESAGKISAKVLKAMDSTSNFIGNTKNYLEVTGGTIDSDATWNELTVPAFFSSGVTVDTEAVLTINPGTILSFGSDNGMYVRGALKAIGTGITDPIGSTTTQDDLNSNTIAKPILFTGEEKTPGYWKGIWFSGSNNVKNELSYVTVEYGGGSNYYGNIEVAGSRLKISDSTFRYSQKDGFYIDGDSTIDKFERVTSTNNEKSAGKIKANILEAIDSASTFSNNTQNYLNVNGGTVTRSVTWHKLSSPAFFSSGVTIEPEASVTVEAGAVMHFGQDNGLYIRGILNSIGTATNPIIFTGGQETSGYWKGLWFSDSNNVDNEIAYTNISYGGGSNYEGIIEITSSRVNIHDNIIANSAKYGITLNDSIVNDDIATSNTFSGNASGDVINTTF